MVSIYKRGSKLYLQYSVNGKRKQRSTGLEDTTANRKLLKMKVIPQLEAKIISGEINEKPPAIFKKYADKYIELKDHKKTGLEVARKVYRICDRFVGVEIKSIKRADVREFASELLKTVSPKTTRNYIGIMRAILELAIEYDEITDNVAEHISLPTHTKQDVEPFTAEEVSRLIDVADGWFKRFLAISFYTGMRTGEVIGLMHGDIDFDGMQIRVSRSIGRGKISTPKTVNGIRTVPMFSNVAPYFKKQIANSRSLYLFNNKDGRHYHGAESVRKHWVKACKDAGVEYRKIYTTRHTFITAMLKSGTVSILELAQIVGHANSEPIMKNYARFIKGEHLKIERNFDPFSVTVQQTQVIGVR